MKKVSVEFGILGRFEEYVDNVVDIEFENEKDFVEKCLLVDFGSEEKCVDYWSRYYNCKSMEEVVELVVDMKKSDLEIGEDYGYVSSEDRFFREYEWILDENLKK